MFFSYNSKKIVDYIIYIYIPYFDSPLQQQCPILFQPKNSYVAASRTGLTFFVIIITFVILLEIICSSKVVKIRSMVLNITNQPGLTTNNCFSLKTSIFFYWMLNFQLINAPFFEQNILSMCLKFQYIIIIFIQILVKGRTAWCLFPSLLPKSRFLYIHALQN